MEGNVQFFDSAVWDVVNNQRVLLLVDEQNKINTPIKVHIVSVGESDQRKWFVRVTPEVGPIFQKRESFESRESAGEFGKFILADQ